MLWLFLLTAVLVLLYLLLIGTIAAYWQPVVGIIEDRLRNTPLTDRPLVSVVVAVRNEEDNILHCLSVLRQQSWPMLQIIIIDDHSEDKTWELLLRHEDENAVFIRLNDQDGKGKKQAVLKGIDVATGDIILLTDADCTAGIRWVESMVLAFSDPEIQLQTGPLFINANDTLIGDMQYYESLGVMALTSAAASTKGMALGNAANLAFRKDAFKEVGGFDGNADIASGDDVFLIERIMTKEPESVRFNNLPSAMVMTHAMPDWKGLIQQRLRWASKNHLLQSGSIQLLWKFVWLYVVVMIVTALSIFAWGAVAAVCFAALIIGKLIADGGLAFLVSKSYGLPFNLVRFLKSFIVYQGYVVYIGLLAALGKGFKWKGR
jgi:cellulose synthase/poly-beta-1,6-N-acetylglucosamine synthase-like glycosyltransferase